MSKGKVPVKKIISIIFTVLTVIIVALAAFVIINMIYCRAKNKPVSFFGVSFAIVQTNSMEPYILTGDLIVFKTCSYDDVKEGDYIVFTAGAEFGKLKGQSIVHAAMEKTEDGIVTRGLHNPANDEKPVTAANLLGICTYNSAGWGKVFSFLGKYGIIIIIALVAVPFAVKQIIKIVKLSKNKEVEEVAAVDVGCAEGDNLQTENVDNVENDDNDRQDE